MIVRNNRGQTLQEYLMSHVNKSDDGCWIWKTGKEGRYPRAEFRNVSEVANRTSYRCFVGEIEEGEIVRHTCDNPKCINPDHLITGSKKDNRQDFMQRHPRAKQICKELINNGSKAVKKFWDSMNEEERKEFCRKRNEKQMQKYPNWSPRKGKLNGIDQKLSVTFLNLMKRTYYWGA